MKVEFKTKEKVKTLNYNQLVPGKIYRVISVGDKTTTSAHPYIDKILLATDSNDTTNIYGIWLNFDFHCYLSESSFNREYLHFEEFNCKLVEV